MRRLTLRATLFVFLAGSAFACQRVYELPAPPPEGARARVTLDPSEEQRLSEEAFLEARRTVLALYEALGAGEWEAASTLLSNETRLLLSGGDGVGAADVLAAGTITSNGTSYAFDPVALLLLPAPDGFEDTMEGEDEAETSRRKEIFATAGDDYRKIVLIEEGGSWRVHMRRLPLGRLQAAP